MNEFEIVFRYEMLQYGKRLAAEFQQQYALGVVARLNAANAIDQAANALSK